MKTIKFLLVILFSIAVAACGGGGGGSAPGGGSPEGGNPATAVTISVYPLSTTVSTGGSQTFSATVSGSSNTSVTWSVQEGASGGTITSAGTYTAPNSAGTYHVIATSQADPTKSVTAIVTVTSSSVVSVVIIPSSVSLFTGANQTFSATVSGSSNTSVTWSVQEGASGGTITSAGTYTAPNSAGTYHVIATSQAEPTKSAMATVIVNIPIIGGLNDLNVTSIVLSSNYANDNTLFAGTQGGGVFKSTNGGSTWVAVNTGLSNLSIASLIISPNYAIDQTLFAGAGTSGVFKSTNGGSTWVAVNTGLSNLSIASLIISPNYAIDQTLFAVAGTSGVFKSTNGGSTWAAVNTGLSYLTVTSLAISPKYAIDQTLFVGAKGSGVFKSTNGGSIWVAANNGLSNLSVFSLGVSPLYSTDQTLFAGVGGSGVFKSTDGGSNWFAANAGLGNLSVSSLAVSPFYATDQTLFAGVGGSGLVKSKDGGLNWYAVNTGLSYPFFSLAISSNFLIDQTVFSGILGSGVVKSMDSGVTWVTATSIPAVSVKINPTPVSLAIGGNQTFTATVSGSSNTAVNWSVQEGVSGGTITSGGVYTAPGKIGTFHVIAASQAVPTQIAIATITVSGWSSIGPYGGNASILVALSIGDLK